MIKTYEDAVSLKNVKDAIDKNNNCIKDRLTGQLANLITEHKDTLVSAINEVFQNGVDFKTAISSAIQNAGGVRSKTHRTLLFRIS